METRVCLDRDRWTGDFTEVRFDPYKEGCHAEQKWPLTHKKGNRLPNGPRGHLHRWPWIIAFLGKGGWKTKQTGISRLNMQCCQLCELGLGHSKQVGWVFFFFFFKTDVACDLSPHSACGNPSHILHSTPGLISTDPSQMSRVIMNWVKERLGFIITGCCWGKMLVKCNSM